MLVRVKIDIIEPLCHGRLITPENGEKTWVDLSMKDCQTSTSGVAGFPMVIEIAAMVTEQGNSKGGRSTVWAISKSNTI